MPGFVPRGWNVPIAPYKWPQDEVAIPSGHGVMPRVNAENKMMVRREGFQYSIRIDNITLGSTQEKIVETEPDGDFWCTNILAQVIDNLGNMNQAGPKCQITDIRTGLPFFKPYGRVGHFIDNPTDTIIPSAIKSFFTGELPQPFVFTRAGGIRLVIEDEAQNEITWKPYTVIMVFSGFKEYANVNQ